MVITQFRKGDKVEVSESDDNGDSQHRFWYPARVVQGTSSKKRGLVQVEYETLAPDWGEKRLKKLVSVENVRPAPPPELHRCFKIGEFVDACFEEAWRRGTVVDILENSRYLVEFDDGRGEQNGKIECEQWGLRVHRQWDDGSWVPPFEEKEMGTEMNIKPKPLKLKIKCNGEIHLARYNKGAEVEVIGREEGYLGSWYAAFIIDSVGDKKVLIEYETLITDEECGFIREEVDLSAIRPRPPVVKRTDRYKQLEEVDVWHNDGWWEGSVFRVLDNFKYIVYFWSTHEQLEYDHSVLRPHQEWENGKWVPRSRVEKKLKSLKPETELKSSATNCSIQPSKAWLRKGSKVEVKSDEDGYQGSWYDAVIIGPMDNDMFLVEYQTLKTDDEAGFLKEKAHVLYMRPCPPAISHKHFELLEEVDTWYNDGWWTGLISKVIDNSKYAVYFGASDEELEFEHSHLRPHQDWRDGKWVLSSMKRSSELERVRDSIIKRYYSGRTSNACFTKGMSVEVRSNKEGYVGAWYTALVLGSRGVQKFLVEYCTLTMDDEMTPFTEMASAANMRPFPPAIEQFNCFKLLEEVDVWYKDGWWVGVVSRILDGCKYIVYFKILREEMEFHHSSLRLHQEWVDGRWVLSSAL